MITPKKSMVFLDASNLLGGWWTYCKTNGFVQNNLKTNRSELTKKIDYDKLIKEISADTDFVDAINYIKSKGKKVWVVSFLNCLGEDTMRVADRCIQLDKIFPTIFK